MIETFKITHNIYDNLTTNSLIHYNTNSVTRSNSYKLFKPRCNTKRFQHFFTNRIINNWNNLPEAIVSSESVNTFKNRLDKHWGNHKFSVDICDI